MKSLSERALLGSMVGVLLASSGCSTSANSGGGTTTPPGSAGSSPSAGGGAPSGGSGALAGATSSGVAGSVIGAGGAASSSAGTGSGTAGALGTAGSAGTAGAASTDVCPTDPNIVNTPSCWVGCDPTLTTDNPQGIQGALYTYGDMMSCPATPADPVCAPTKGVCLAGSTIVDPKYAAYGCGIGLELNATGGMASVKQAYTGPAKCFDYVLTGDSGGNEVRIGFTQFADNSGKVAPYVSIPAFANGKSGTVCTKDVSCQGQMGCTLGTAPYDIQFEVVGGNHAGAYSVCLSSLKPVVDGTSTLAQLCGVQGSANGTADVGKYFVQNNVFPGTASNKLCVTPKATTGGAGFTVDSATFATGANLNAYPSVVDGWHYGRISSDTALPKQISALASASSSVSYTGSVGKYDAAYDIWVLPNKPTTATMSPSGGLEVMIWLNSATVVPSGSSAGQYTGGWDVFVGTINDSTGSWHYVAYRKNGQTTYTGDVAPFVKDALTRIGVAKATTDTWWLSGIEFGFELYDYPGTGFAVTNFTSDVK